MAALCRALLANSRHTNGCPWSPRHSMLNKQLSPRRLLTKLAGKVAVVTGGSQGIGKEVVKQFLIKKMKVCVADIDIKITNQMMEEMKKSFPDGVLMATNTDVTNEEALEKLLIETKKKFGRLDVLINNAGIGKEKRWREMLNLNLIAVIHGTNLAFKHLCNDKGKPGGMVINTCSIVGIKAFILAPVYTATKHGVAGFTKCWGDPKNVVKTNVKVNAVCPEATQTKVMRDLGVDNINAEKGAQLMEYVDKNVLDPAFVATAYVKLLEEGVTGALLVASLHKGLYYQSTDTLNGEE